MPEENRLLGAEPAENLRKYVERLLVKERRSARLERWIRTAVPEPREGDDTPGRRPVQRLRESPPGADGPEPLVQQDERALGVPAGVLYGFEAPTVDLEVEIDASVYAASPEDDGSSATPR